MMKNPKFLSLIFFIAMTLAVVAADVKPCLTHFDPALRGGEPNLTITPNPEYTGETIRLKVIGYVVDTVELSLAEHLFKSTDSVRFVLPNRGHRDYLGVKLEKCTQSKQIPVIGWRTLYIPGESLMDYQGNDKLKVPADFDQFWNQKKAQLAQSPLAYEIIPVPEKSSATGNLYKIIMNSYGNVTIACWYFVPKDVNPLSHSTGARKYPAIQLMPGYGGGVAPVDRTADGYITLSMNIRGMSISGAYFKVPSSGYHLPHLDDADNHYYVQAYMDCVRGIDFLSDRPEVDKQRIAAEGGSQGGALCLGLAGLDHRIAVACASVPSLSNFWDFSRIGVAGTSITWYSRMTAADIGERVVKTLDYLDVSNHATRITCPVQICVGGEDRVCPPVNGIVAYNHVPPTVPRNFVIDPNTDHAVTKVMRDANQRWYQKYLLKN